MRTWIYPAIAVLVPQLWAFVFARGVAWQAARKERAARARAAKAPGDFSI